jgi:hypothetical protein
MTAASLCCCDCLAPLETITAPWCPAYLFVSAATLRSKPFHIEVRLPDGGPDCAEVTVCLNDLQCARWDMSARLLRVRRPAGNHLSAAERKR